MKKNNLKVVKIDKNKNLFNYEKKIFIKELSESDPFQVVAKEIPLVKKLIDRGYTGR